MPENLDVGARLAQGRPAADTLQRYVWACGRLGYEHRDLTLHPEQVADWYGTEDGMDLATLHRSRVALAAVGRAAQEALTVQERQLAQLPVVWEGAGGDAARRFLARHGDSSAAVAASVRAAADALASLREELWRVVGLKVDATVSAEGRAGDAQAEWSAAATSVTTGAGDTATAGEIVEQAVKPFVDSVIRDEWLPSMRDGVAAVTAAYDGAIAEIWAQRTPTFDLPGDLGPDCPEPQRICDDDVGTSREITATGSGVAAAPAAWSPSGGAPVATAPAGWSFPAPPPVASPEAPAPPAAAAPLPAAAPPLPSLGSMGSGMPGLGGGLSGFGQQFADALSGLLGGGLGGDALESPDPSLEGPELEEPDPDEVELEEEPDPEEVTEVEKEGADDEGADEEGAEDAAPAAAAEEPCDPPPEPPATVAAPEPPAPSPPAEPVPVPPAEPASGEQTPCEIAAGEVPQVGEPSG